MLSDCLENNYNLAIMRNVHDHLDKFSSAWNFAKGIYELHNIFRDSPNMNIFVFLIPWLQSIGSIWAQDLTLSDMAPGRCAPFWGGHIVPGC